MSEVFDNAVFWPAFGDAGLLRLATVKQKGASAVDVYVGYNEPDRSNILGAARSKEYEIEFQVGDLPKLAEGDAVTIWTDARKTVGTKFKVRETPFVPENPLDGVDGFFKRALLTKL